MQMATFWTYDDYMIQLLNQYASEELELYKKTNDPFWKDLYDAYVNRIQELKCYDC